MNTIILTLALIFMANPSGQNNDTAVVAESEEVVLASDLITAIRQIDIMSVNLLLAEGAYVDSVDVNGNTPLMVASRIGNPRIVRILLAHDPSINAKNLKGETALMIAAENGQVHIARQLIVRGAHLDERNQQGLNAREIALRNGHTQIVNLLESEPDGFIAR